MLDAIDLYFLGTFQILHRFLLIFAHNQICRDREIDDLMEAAKLFFGPKLMQMMRRVVFFNIVAVI